MSQVFAGVALVGLVAAWITGVLAWFAIIVFGFKAVRRTRPGVDRWGGETWGNPANALLRPGLLTKEGLRYRRNCIISICVFISSVGAGLLIGVVTGQLK